MNSVKFLGLSCKTCQALVSKAKEIITKIYLNAFIEKVTDIQLTMDYEIMITHGLVLNEKVKSFEIMTKDDQIINWLKEN